MEPSPSKPFSAVFPAFDFINRWRAGIPLLLAVATFLVYLPSLKSDFVYDARIEILQEGFITSFANLSDVLTLKVLHTHLTLHDRPGQLLYLMLIAAVCGKAPFGYHLCNNLLHAATVALLFILVRRLLETNTPGPVSRPKLLLAAAVSLLFAVHPMNVESVAEISYSSSPLVAFFTLLALIAATAFCGDHLRSALIPGVVVVLCALAAVMCKESGAAVAPLLFIYWWLFRRGEKKLPWFLLIGGAVAVTLGFLAVLYLMSFKGGIDNQNVKSSMLAIALIQPRLWVLMMVKSIWPYPLSADYTPANIRHLTLPLALAILAVVLYLQAWLSVRHRIGALGVAVYWLGLATVSNFIPLFHAEADRYYYLPLAGEALQLLALFLIWTSWSTRWTTTLFLCAFLAMTFLTLQRQQVFADETSLWTATVRVSPDSVRAHNGLGVIWFDRGNLDQAIAEYKIALKITDYDEQVHNNMGVALLRKGETEEAIAELQKALDLEPFSLHANFNMGDALFQAGRVGEAILQYRKTVELDPGLDEAYSKLGIALEREGRTDEAMVQFQEALRHNPDNDEAQDHLAKLQAKRDNQLVP